MRITGRVLWRGAWLGGELLLDGIRFAFLYLRTFGRPTRRQRAHCLCQCARGTMRPFLNRIEVMGRVPTSGLLVCNHLSYLDIVVLGSLTPTVFISKHEVKNWPVFGWFASLGGTVYVRRESRGQVGEVAAQIHSLLQDGQLVVLFPEGTSSGGETVLPFKSSLLEPAVAGRHNLHAGCVAYQLDGGTVSADVAYWGDMVFGPHLLKLLDRDFVTARVGFADMPEPAADRKALAKQLHATVSDLHTRVRF